MSKKVFFSTFFLLILFLSSTIFSQNLPEFPIKVIPIVKFVNESLVPKGVIYAVDCKDASRIISLEYIPSNDTFKPQKLLVINGSTNKSLIINKPPSNCYKFVLEYDGLKILSNESFEWKFNNRTLYTTVHFYLPEKPKTKTPSTSLEGTSEGIVLTKGEENVTENIIKKLEQEKIKDIVQKIIPIQNITEAEVEKNITLEIKPKVEEVLPKVINITHKIEKELEEKLKNTVSVNIQPIDTKVTIKLIKIKTKTGEEKYFTKIEKVVNENKVIEVIPKHFANISDEVYWITGKILKILEKDPVFEVQPENNTVAYLVEGNKTKEAKETITITYTYKIVEKPVTNVTQPTKPEIKPKPQNATNITKPKENVTVQKPKKPKTNVWILVGIVIIFVVVGIIAYLKKKGLLKIGE